MTDVFAVSISARALLNLHSLNNEGGEGNQTQTRMVDVFARDAEGTPRQVSVNAISGDMFKHIQAAHLHRISIDRGLVLCEACRKFDANRMSADSEFRQFVQQKEKPTQVQVIDRLITHCAMDDLEGNLITEGNLSAPRKSVGEFGWIVGVPEANTTEEYFHVKYAPDRREKPTDKDEREGNLGQAIFHRPASSGEYAMVCHFDTARIGYNDITQAYVISAEERENRYRALLESVLYTFLEPGGAMRNTQLPHIMDFIGVVAVSTRVVPAPALSPLAENYRDDLAQTAQVLNQLHGEDSVIVMPFEGMAAFTEIMRELIQTTTPYSLKVS
jgi:CRISPR-associated protein Cst2